MQKVLGLLILVVLKMCFKVAGAQTAILTIFYNGDDGDGVFSLICDRPNLDFGLQLLRVFYGHQQDPLRRLIRMGTNPLKCSSAKHCGGGRMNTMHSKGVLV